MKKTNVVGGIIALLVFLLGILDQQPGLALAAPTIIPNQSPHRFFTTNQTISITNQKQQFSNLQQR